MKAFRSVAAGFSLIEVVIAVGVVAFAIFGVFGLMPVGMRDFQNATCESAGADVLSTLSVALRSAQTSDGTNFDWSFGGTNCRYALGGSASSNGWSSLSLEGVLPDHSLYGQLCAVCIVTPPQSATGEGAAVLSVAWPSSANPVYNPANQRWSRCQGWLTLPIRFIPRMPLP